MNETKSTIVLRPVDIILILMSVLTLIKLIICYTSWGEYLYHLMWGFDDRTLFYDHFDHIKYCLVGNIKGVYGVNVNACFPALAYLYYGFLAHLCAADQVDVTEFKHVFSTNSGLITLVFVYGFILSAIILVLYKHLHEKIGSLKTTWLIFMMLFSTIFIMTVASGNLAIGAMLLTLTSLYFRDSESPALREFSMILLALAAGLKIYPAIWGMLYLKEKRFKEAFRLIGYGLFVFLFPFVFFGGVTGFVQFFRNIAAVSHVVTDITLVGLCEKVFSRFVDSPTAIAIGRVIDYIYLLATFLLVFLKKKIDWKSYALFAGAMFIFNAESGSYCMCYWTIALVFFVREIGNLERTGPLEMLYAVLFAFSFNAIPIFSLGSSVIPASCLYAIVLIIMIDGFLEVIRDIRRTSNA
ncbi:MAG: glycosyltransferase 87 family protein [Lachnospiraceae bacterium]|nr:glycosyltransferase 87 family protein [Lachnospiraceae bacterium]